MSRLKGSIIGAKPTWTTTATSGIFSLGDVADLKAASQWPRGPVAPTNLDGTLADNGQATLTWTAPATTHGTITDYAVEYTPSGGSPTVVLTGSTAASYTVTGLIYDTLYTFRVAGVNHTRGEWSSSVTMAPLIQVVATPELYLKMNGSLEDSSPNDYVINNPHTLNPGFDSTNKVFGSHSRIYQPYYNDSLSDQGAAVVSMFAGDFTVECFYRLNPGAIGSTITAGGVWGVLDLTGNSMDSMALFFDLYSEGYIGFYWYNGANASGTVYSSTAMIGDGVFRHIAVVRDGTWFRVYYDGNRIIETTSANNADPWTTPSLMLSVGTDPYMMGYDGTDGNIDDFRIYSAAMYSGATINVPTSELT